MTNDELVTTIRVLQNEVEVLGTRIKPQATGHLHTAISVINERINELVDEVKGISNG